MAIACRWRRLRWSRGISSRRAAIFYVAGQGDAADNNDTIKIRGNRERELNFGFLDVYGTMPVGVQFVEALAIFDGYITCLRCVPTALELARGAFSTS